LLVPLSVKSCVAIGDPCLKILVCACLRLPCGIPPSAGPQRGIPQGESAANYLLVADLFKACRGRVGVRLSNLLLVDLFEGVVNCR